MKATGIVRKVDELGRIVLPIELRRTLDIAERDPLEIYVDGPFYLGMTYQFGLVNVLDSEEYGKLAKMKNRNFTIAIGYNF